MRPGIHTPVELAQHHQNLKTAISKDMVHVLLDVQAMILRKIGTRVQLEQAIARCQERVDGTTMIGAAAEAGASARGNIGAVNGPSGNHPNRGSSNNNKNSSGSGHHRRSSADEQEALQQGLLAHIELKMLLPLRKKFLSHAELLEQIASKTRERERLLQMGPQHLARTMSLNEELIALEKQLKREQDALIPDEIQATRQALYERLQAPTTTRTDRLRPINNVSLRFLEECTDNFSTSNRIGQGGFGSVYRAYDAVTCAQYAVKKTEKYDDPSLLREVEVLADVFHPNIINLLGFYVPPQGQAPEYLVYEYASGGTLADRVSTDENRESLTWSIRVSAAVGIASGLNYLHHGTTGRTIFHHDVKPENIVFSETLDRAILIDCGISKVLKESQAAAFKKTMAGTPFYLPDDCTEDTPYDEKCEVFFWGDGASSFGVWESPEILERPLCPN
ncbi:hypothetical protein ACA910_003039 [Epithemia clementina (nom. ined.)]